MARIYQANCELSKGPNKILVYGVVGFIKLNKALGGLRDISNHIELKFMILKKTKHKLSPNGLVFAVQNNKNWT